MNRTYCYLLAFFICSCNYSKPIIKTGYEGTQMPSSFALSNGFDTSMTSTSSIINGSPFVFIYFSPDCPYCRAMVSSLLKRDRLFTKVRGNNKINIYLITNAGTSDIKKFEADYKIKGYENIIVLEDHDERVAKYYNISSIPFTMIYDRLGKLKTALNGLVDVDVIEDEVEEY